MKKKQLPNIFLIGPMGAGKSTVGHYLAKELRIPFFDTDEEIENRTGVEIGWIFDLEGEVGFRKRETEVIEDITQQSPIVLATGGGSILEAKNRQLLKSRGVVIYLRVSLNQQKTRTLNEIRRPLLRVKNRDAVLIRLAEEREHLYEEIADFHVETDARTARVVAEDIIQWLEKRSL